ncbi:MAG: cytidine deaminase [Ruminococcaceae bacterium]|nr:cytidine deaminase [Oscillospiraceae bacterium]
MTDTQLIQLAEQMLSRSYAPYSKFCVGAALLGKNGKVYTGCNIESAAFGATICAERCALSTAVADGCREFETIAVISSADDYCSPCGICRQLIFEFGQDTRVLCARNSEDYKEYKISELLPLGFGPSNL